MVGFPLLAGFPPRLVLWQELAAQSIATALWVCIGVLGLLIGAFRTLAVFVTAGETPEWRRNETVVQSAMLVAGVTGLFLLGLFPQVAQSIISQLPAIFEHLGR